MLPTPDLSHLTKQDYTNIYEPAEDTFILLDALEEDTHELQALAARISLEIGSGSGCVSAFVGKILGSSDCLYLCTDINAHASRCTKLTGQQNCISLEAVTASLAGPFTKRLYHLIDLLIFNPPYVPTFSDEARQGQERRGIEGALAGGRLGMEITNKVLDGVGDLLSNNGRFYLVAVKNNDVESIRRKMLMEQNLDSQIVLQRRAGREHLFVIKFYRKQADY